MVNRNYSFYVTMESRNWANILLRWQFCASSSPFNSIAKDIPTQLDFLYKPHLTKKLNFGLLLFVVLVSRTKQPNY